MRSLRADLRGAVLIDKMQPQFAATIAANSDGYFPVAGESAFWLEVQPGIVVKASAYVAASPTAPPKPIPKPVPSADPKVPSSAGRK